MMLLSSFCSRIFSVISTRLDWSINPWLEENEFINKRGANNLQVSVFFLFGFLESSITQLLLVWLALCGLNTTFSIENETHFITDQFHNLLSYLFLSLDF